jgi:hypothetical protein
LISRKTPWSEPGYRWFALRCNIFQDYPDFVHAPTEVIYDRSPFYQTPSAICIRPTSKVTSVFFVVASAAAIGVLAAIALLNRHLANKAEQDNPPAGRFLDVDGVRLHYVERGSGEPLVLLHGNGSMIQGFRIQRSD